MNEKYLIVGVCIVIVFVLLSIAGYFWYTNTNTNNMPVVFGEKIEELGKEDSTFIGMVRGDLKNLPDLYQYLPAGSAVITYTASQELCVVTFWEIQESGIAQKIGLIEYRVPEFYRIRAITREGISVSKIAFWDTSLLVVIELLGSIIGAAVGFAINNAVERRRRKMNPMAQ